MSITHHNRGKLDEFESKLRAHPGIREAAAVWESDLGEEKLVGYIVPDDGYLDRLFANAGEQRKRMQKWQKTFNLSQLGKQAEFAEPGFNIVGWNSSYTRRPIPPAEMREWVDFTVREILLYEPKEVLEIGCGTGLLLIRIAPNCNRYVGTDFAAAVLKSLKKQINEMGGACSGVTVLERSAEDFSDFADNSFDTVILNSVVKYFPSADYLVRVLQQAARVVRPGGRIFVGDVRNLMLLEAYAISVELYQAPPAMRLADLRERVRRRVLFDDQLVISPTFFLAMQRHCPKISKVEITPRKGYFDNEMTRFRYNGVLHVDSVRHSAEELPWLEWTEQQLNLGRIRELLRKQMPEILAIKTVTDARVEKDIEALAMLSRSQDVGVVDDLKEALRTLEPSGIDPQELWSLGEELGYQVDVSWAACHPNGSYDVVFRRPFDDTQLIRGAIAWPQPPLTSKEVAGSTTMPGRAVLREMLIQQLHDDTKQALPGDINSAAFVIMDALPKDAEGKVNRSALPHAHV